MYLTETQIIKQNNPHYNRLMDMLHKSKNLYNAALYEVRQHYINAVKTGSSKKYLNSTDIWRLFKDNKNVDFYALPSGMAQQVLMQVDRTFSSFFALLKLKLSGQYNEHINIPKYLNKNGYNLITITNDRFGVRFKKDGTLTIQKTKPNKIQFKIINYKTCKQVRFVPCGDYIKLEAIYEFNEPKLNKNNDNYLSIDMGIDNLCACTCVKKGRVVETFLIDGKKLKSINQRYNKYKAKLQSRLPKITYWSNQLSDITKKRNFRVDNYLHNVTAYIMNHVVSNEINTIVIGYNTGWKQDINIGKKNNQKFTQIPFYKLIHMIKYKCQKNGINFAQQEESYTSKASFLDNDEIPTYDKNKSVPESIFCGKRMNRGLYITCLGLRVNADINGSLNILRKYLKCNSDAIYQPADRGFVVNPVRIKF